MNNLFKFYLLTTLFCFLNVSAQDQFECRRLTFEKAQNGFPTWSPDSKTIIYEYINMRDTLGKNGLWKISPDGKKLKQIFKGIAEHPKWSPDGRFIVFDADTGNNIKMIPAEGGNVINFLPDSIHIHNGGLPCWSPDGSRIAFKDSKYSLCIYSLTTDKTTHIFNNKEGMLLLPGCWSHDGKSIFVALMDRQSRKSAIQKIYIDGTLAEQIPRHHKNFYRYLALSPDGSLLVYAAKEGKYLGLWIMPVEGGKSLPLAVTKYAHNEGAAWSPDGKFIAFTSTRSGNFDVWIMDVDIKQLENKLRELNK